ncbi:DUF6702 family protein [Alteromonas sp. C1M14]|uniref:DUF6702 family protein n=1 Tax=Alteromonas sp. C1M14 TaxID=2841567 RepID=UPI001C09786D|nr:DUF6702 family protein [Alteromonas sp. C1M14]MBU2978398.1 hypothetical protein [Alteromonas sp. C1M14]
MTIKSLRTAQWGLLALLLFSTATSAHQIKAAITTVLFNPRTENIEIMHRFNLHDAEHAVKALFDKKADILDDEATQKEFAEYIEARFALLDINKQPLALNTVGYEVDGKFFWVYQETAQPPALEGLTIRHDALRDLWPDQINTLNVEGQGDVKTLTFRDNVELLSVEFQRHH